MRTATASILVALLCATPPARAASGAALIPPVDGAITRGFEAPAGPYAAGHRGIDYAIARGSLVRAAAAGTVSFAGMVAGARAVTIDHGAGLQTTYSSLGSTLVHAGDAVTQGQWIGRAGSAHAGEPSGGLHFGVKLDGSYVDPQSYLAPVDLSAAIHLAPTTWQPPDVLTPAFTSAFHDAGDYRQLCRPAESIEDAPPPPNDNVAVAIAGIGSKTKGGVDADIYEHGPEQLGYPAASIYHFSYKGAKGPLLHEPYERADSYEGLRVAARKLRAQLVRVAARFPGRSVDLIAHSQGGVVARLFLQSMERAWDPRLPVVDHLVTFSTPYEGAPLAGDVAGLDRTVTGPALLDAGSRWAHSGGPLPDPRSAAVADLAPGSPVVRSMAREDISFGTRALSIGMANDLLVPADRSRLPHSLARVVAPQGLDGHSAVVSSDGAIATAYAFLRDARTPCAGAWDTWGPRLGRVAGWVESRLPRAFGALERAG